MPYITEETAMFLWDENKTPKHVVRHCRAVAQTSLLIGEELNKHGYNLSLEVILGAAWLHDVARVQDRHEEVGADIVLACGFEPEAKIIQHHMHHEITTDVNQIQEIDVVCLSDRMVKEDQFVGLMERMEYVLEKWKGNQEAEEVIRQKFKEQRNLLDEIEKKIGIPIETLISQERK